MLSIETSTLVALLLGSIRAAAWLMLAPPFSTRAIPRKVKTLLSVAFTLPVLPRLAETAPAPETGALLVASIEQVVIGSALGFLTAMIFAAVQAAGDLLDIFGGFSLAASFDPMTGTQNSVFGRFFGLFATALLFATSGHQLVIRGFMMSYDALPLDASMSMATLSELLTGGLTTLFVSALQIAAPLIAVLFLTDLGLGMLNKAAPALNIFALSFPIKIAVVLSLAGLVITTLPGVVDGLSDQAVRTMRAVTG